MGLALLLLQELQVTGRGELISDVAPVILLAQEALPLAGRLPRPQRTLALDPSGRALVQLPQHDSLPGSGYFLSRREPGFPLLQDYVWRGRLLGERSRGFLDCARWL